MSRRKPYVRSMQGWWRGNSYFTRYMLREGTSVLLALYALVLLAGIVSLTLGEASYLRWLAVVQSPASVLFHVLVLIAALYHSVTWFAVSPKAMPVIRLGGKALAPGLIIAGQYAASAVASFVILAVAWGG